ncbi:MAG: IS3 family transposase [Pseudomonadota bacterium]
MAVQADLRVGGDRVSIMKLCRWFGLPRRSFYYQAKPRQLPLDPSNAVRVKSIIEQFPTYGYRRIAAILGWNKKVVQRICQMKGWQVRKRAKGHRPRAKTLPSVANRPNERWSTDLTMLWCGRDRHCHLALVIDCSSREILGWRLAKNGNAKTAEAALEEALIHRFGHLGKVLAPLALRSDNGLVFSSKRFTETVKAYGLTQEFITPYTPEQNGLIERFIRTIKEECIWQHHFENLAHARQVIGQWIRHYNTERPHQALGYQTPAQLAA